VREHAASGRACILASHDGALLERLDARIVTMPERAASDD